MSNPNPNEKRMKAKELKRKNVIDSLTRIETFVTNFVPQDHANEVPLRLQRLEKLMDSFETVQSEYEELDDSEKVVLANLELRAKVEETYFRVKAALLTSLPTPPTPGPSTPQANPAPPPAPNALPNVKLPTITLPEFDGDFNGWLTFHDTFLSMIHSSTEISSVQKFHYLRAALKGEAANLIQSITITTANYSIAWDTLVKRYSNKRLLRKKHIRAILKYPKIPNNSVEALHRILDEFQRHTKVLQQLGEPVDEFSSILMEILEDKLDDASLSAWEEAIVTDDNPTYEKMVEFLQKRSRVLETIMINRPNSSQSKPASHPTGNKKQHIPRVSANAMTETGSKSYPLCPACEKQRHSLMDCSVFSGMDVQGRLKVVGDKKLCSNCFRSDHFARACRSKYVCKHCTKRHHSMVHPGYTETQAQSGSQARIVVPGNQPPSSSSRVVTAVATTETPVDRANAQLVASNAAVKGTNTSVLLSTVVLIVVDAYGQEHFARALLDTGSQPNAMSERLCQQLHLTRKTVNVPISGVDGTLTNAKHQVSTELRSRVTGFKQPMDFLVLRKVTSDTPAVSFPTATWKIPEFVSLADPEFNVSRRIDIIIGAGHFYAFLRDGRIRLTQNLPMLVETVFGWIVTGRMEASGAGETVACHVAQTPSVDDQLERFWRLEEVSGSNYSVDEQRCEDFYRETITRDNSGRYIVRMPKHPQFDQLFGRSKETALQRFRSLERMLDRKPDLKPQYHDFVKEYLALGHMEEVPDDDVDRPDACYLPHHPVVKESSSTTKVRVVFDGSAKMSSGHSLNEALLVGPVVQDELLTIVLRFRQYPIALVADIEKMYRQVSLHPADRPLQRIFWRFNSDEPIKAYELSTVTYGLAPSSFLATRTLQQVVEDEGPEFPEASRVVKKDVYVDDLISGERTVERAIQLQKDLMELLQRGGFRLRKWVSNSLEVLAAIPEELQGTRTPMKFDPEETIKTLGISWEPETDDLRFNVSVDVRNSVPTKREVLSTIAQLYDPLGLVSPVVVQAKILMQQLWLLSLGWDDKITPDLHRKWTAFCQQLPALSNFRIDRNAFIPNYCVAELHTFADASQDAYGACVYIRSEDANGNVKVNLLASKSKVAPLKPISIPRLELCAALLASRLYEKVVAALDQTFSQKYFWSDSTVVLQWMKSPPRTWKTFVANRISEIQATTHGSLWLHVAGAENPADLLSRGFPADELVTCDKWLHGPSWLSQPKEIWPIQNLPRIELPTEELEQRPTVLALQTAAPNEIFLRFSSYDMLLNAVGLAFRFIRNARSTNNRIPGRVLLVRELHATKMFLVKLVQSEVFPDELKALRKGLPVSKHSKLRLLSPFLDSEGVIRVGGRLQLSAESYNIRHQIVIPGFHPFTKLLIMYHHKKLVHGGNTVTLAVVRDEFWPLHGRRAVRSVLRSCFDCYRADPRPIEQPVGQLPSGRVTANEAFACTGVDYCGPLYLKPVHKRAAPQKIYVCVFVCFSTKAVHLELAGDLSTNTFLMALDRFIYRRTKPDHLYSDNGKNFIGAKNALHQLYARLQSESENNTISKYLAQDGIQWHLIPPRSPNFGGLWEAAVKVAKKQLVRQLGDSLLSYEELLTILVRIEGCMNSRPLMPLSDDPHDLTVLTPAHFLVKNMIRPLPEPDLRHLPMNRLDFYQRIQAHSQQFWHRWRSEYLKELQTQYTTNPKRCDLEVGSVVILKDDSLPPARWPLARILEVHPGPDDVVRVVTLQTAGGVLKRSVSKICPLPKEEVE